MKHVYGLMSSVALLAGVVAISLGEDNASFAILLTSIILQLYSMQETKPA